LDRSDHSLARTAYARINFVNLLKFEPHNFIILQWFGPHFLLHQMLFDLYNLLSHHR